MNPTHAGDLVIAIDVGGTSIKGELVDADGLVLTRVRQPTPKGDKTLGAIAEVGDALLTHVAGLDADVVGSGVVVPGLVDAAQGIATYSSNIGWRDLVMAAPLSERWGTPVRLANDVASAAVAEMRQGAGRGETYVGFVVIGTGIAAALVVDGRLVTGAHGEVTEIGHVPVRPGNPCACGADGCLETVASASSIARLYAARSGVAVTGAADVVARLDSDPVAREVWQEAIEALADAISLLALVANPALVVIGGGLGVAGDDLVAPLTAAVRARTRVVEPPHITVAELGDRGGVVGAALLAREPWATS
ncbi:ROK family protein [Nocardioides sp. InS609-2]|uniref:ROK family protein n=1 Tax=Nocardioides sp. InS609-2 TaxID=2760705 RepID=UPI0020C0CA4C|nr:ROK family protein [Nocardioides sp. InS609-2]